MYAVQHAMKSLRLADVVRSWRDARWTLAPRNCCEYAAAIVVRLKELAPYALIELVLPGGSVMALLLWLYRRRKNADIGPVLAGGSADGVRVD